VSPYRRLRRSVSARQAAAQRLTAFSSRFHQAASVLCPLSNDAVIVLGHAARRRRYPGFVAGNATAADRPPQTALAGRAFRVGVRQARVRYAAFVATLSASVHRFRRTRRSSLAGSGRSQCTPLRLGRYRRRHSGSATRRQRARIRPPERHQPTSGRHMGRTSRQFIRISTCASDSPARGASRFRGKR